MAAEVRPHMHHEARTGLQFLLEAGGAVALLAGTTIVAHRLHATSVTPLTTAIQLTPIVPVWLLMLTIWRHYRRIDELQRLLFLQSIALTAGALVGVAWSWPSLQRAFGWEAPDFTMWHIHFSVLFVVISALLTKVRTQPR
jgi:hypothetical protein